MTITAVGVAGIISRTNAAMRAQIEERTFAHKAFLFNILRKVGGNVKQGLNNLIRFEVSAF